MDSLLLSIEFVPSKISGDLTNQQRQLIYEMLLRENNNGVLQRGSLTTIASKFSVCPKTIARIWKQAKYFLDNGLGVNVSFKKSEICLT